LILALSGELQIRVRRRRNEAMATPRDEFIAAAFWHGSRPRADEILAAHPAIAADIHVAAMLGDDAAVRRFIAADPSAPTSTSGPRNVDPLTHLCFSVYLRDESRSDAFVRAATALLDAGASITSGFFDDTHLPTPEFESLLYGAAGVHFSEPLTRLLLERGANPNDEEVPYHSVEGPHNGAFRALLESGKMSDDSLNMMLLRKTDWHDYEGVKMVLDRDVDPNRMTRWGKTALHNAVISDNGLDIIDLLLDRGADPTIVASRPGRGGDTSLVDKSVVSMAARRGRADALASFEHHGFSIALHGVDGLILACAMDDGAAIRAITAREPALVQELLTEGAELTAAFAGTANTSGLARLLDLGVPVDATYSGNGYMGIAPNSTALHVAAWRAWQGPLELLIARGADVSAKDERGRTPLVLAVAAATQSFWTNRRSPDGVRALLAAGASKDGIVLPTGYDAIDVLLG
jgi:ankyrin repeat protein